MFPYAPSRIFILSTFNLIMLNVSELSSTICNHKFKIVLLTVLLLFYDFGMILRTLPHLSLMHDGLYLIGQFHLVQCTAFTSVPCWRKVTMKALFKWAYGIHEMGRCAASPSS
ncbi:hypothetical protein BKA64DRAFT_650864 [Cadophora sp. MPI-SDFR-AT-0126]|nr:hypothetical protein BKA64DRAFT_650864 [Leotiomycetes sp. MPI-SDFR-AT-0126]